MTEEAKKARSQYYREWRAKNPEKVKRSQERYWARKAEKMKENEGQEIQAKEVKE